jgi:hypothetical protein
MENNAASSVPLEDAHLLKVNFGFWIKKFNEHLYLRGKGFGIWSMAALVYLCGTMSQFLESKFAFFSAIVPLICINTCAGWCGDQISRQHCGIGSS